MWDFKAKRVHRRIMTTHAHKRPLRMRNMPEAVIPAPGRSVGYRPELGACGVKSVVLVDLG